MPSTACSGVTPIMVKRPRGFLSNTMLPMIIRPVFSRAALIARLTSSSAIIVSKATPSAPPSSNAVTCSAKASYISSSDTGPSGARNSPVGPAVATTWRPSGAALRACPTASRLSSRTRSPCPYFPRRNLLPPKELVSTKSEPAAKNSAAICRTTSGCVTFISSGHAPGSSPCR